MRVLVTGASGLVGTETAEALRRAGCEEVLGSSRTRHGDNPSLIAWDMTVETPPDALRGPWDAIVHSAADTRWTMTPDDALAANVRSVHALESLVGPDTHLVHISTAFSLGLRGSIESSELSDYRNTYEWSKAHAERLVRAMSDRVTIIRPPLIIGRLSDGRAARFTGMYTILRAIAASMVPVVVADADAYFEVVPVDAVAEVITEAALAQGTGSQTLTLGRGSDALRVGHAVESMTDALNGWRKKHGLEPLDAPRLISRESWDRFFYPFVVDELTHRQRRILELLSNFEPYLEIHEPLVPTHHVGDPVSAIFAATRYWADTEPNRASLALRPWTAADGRLHISKETTR